LFEQLTRIEFEGDKTLNGRQGIPEQVTGPLQRTEQVPKHRKLTALDVFEQQRRAASLVDAPLNSPYLKVGIKFIGYAYQLAATLQVGNARGKITITHNSSRTVMLSHRILADPDRGCNW